MSEDYIWTEILVMATAIGLAIPKLHYLSLFQVNHSNLSILVYVYVLPYLIGALEKTTNPNATPSSGHQVMYIPILDDKKLLISSKPAHRYEISEFLW